MGVVRLLFTLLVWCCFVVICVAADEHVTEVEFGETDAPAPDIAELEKRIAAQQAQLDALRVQKCLDNGGSADICNEALAKGNGNENPPKKRLDRHQREWDDIDDGDDGDDAGGIVDPLALQLHNTYERGVSEATLLFVQRNDGSFRPARSRGKHASRNPARARRALVLTVVAEGRNVRMRDVPYGLNGENNGRSEQQAIHVDIALELPVHPDIGPDVQIQHMSVSSGHIASTGNDVHVALHLSDGIILLRALALWTEPVDGEMAGKIKVLSDVVITPAQTEEREKELSHNYNFKNKELADSNMGSVTGLQLYQKRKFVSLFASYDDGCVRLFTSNGTLRSVLHSRDAENSDYTPIADMVVTLDVKNQRMAFVSARGVSSLKISQAHYKVDSYCDYLNATSNDTITSVAFHPLRSHVLFGATSSGKLVQFIAHRGNRDKPNCAAMNVIDVANTPLRMTSSRGYLYLTTTDKLFVYNVSSVSRKAEPEFVLERSFASDASSGSGSSSSLSSPLGVQSYENYAEDIFVVISRHRDVWAYRSHLYVKKVEAKESGFRMPMFLVGMFVVALYQIYKKKTRQRDFSPPGGFGSMGQGFGGGQGFGAPGRGNPPGAGLDSLEMMREFQRMQQGKYSSNMKQAARNFKANTFRDDPDDLREGKTHF